MLVKIKWLTWNKWKEKLLNIKIAYWLGILKNAYIKKEYSNQYVNDSDNKDNCSAGVKCSIYR